MTFVAILLSAAVPQVSACLVPASWARQEQPGGLVANVVRLRHGVLTFNYVPIDEQTLEKFLSATTKLVPRPRLVVDIDPMDCATLSRIAAAVRRAGVDCQHGMCVATDIVDPPPAPAPSRRH